MRLTLHPRLHWRLYLALVLGAMVWALSFSLAGPLRLVLAGDAFFLCYLVLVFSTVARADAERMRRAARAQDEGVAAIFLIMLAVVILSVTAIFVLLNEQQDPPAVNIVLAIVSVVLGWLTFQTVLASHYAHRYYNARPGTKGWREDAGGLDIPHADEPGWWEFFYHALVIGMTAQVADIDITTTAMRRLVIAHSVVAFFYNTIIIALAINVVAGQAH